MTAGVVSGRVFCRIALLAWCFTTAPNQAPPNQQISITGEQSALICHRSKLLSAHMRVLVCAIILKMIPKKVMEILHDVMAEGLW